MVDGEKRRRRWRTEARRKWYAKWRAIRFAKLWSWELTWTDQEQAVAAGLAATYRLAHEEGRAAAKLIKERRS